MSFIPGANVGPYRIVDQAERTGVATSYTAYQPSLGRYVSVIAVPTIPEDDLALQRQQQRQIDLVLSLRHPNILTVLDHGDHMGVGFIVTELLEAEPLSERLGAPWPLNEVVRVIRPVAAALDFAHRQGIVHGDVRPRTVLMTPDGTPILAGFGQTVRRFTTPLGDPEREPGRLTGSVTDEIERAQQADRRGLALIAFEMLTGRTMQVEAADLDRPLPPSQLGSPLLAPPVERALLRELTGSSAERFATATLFVEDLAQPLAPPTVAAAPAPAATEDDGLVESRRRLIAAALIIAALAILGGIVVFVRGDGASRPIVTPSKSPTTEAPVAVATGATPRPAGGSPVVGAGTGSAAPKVATNPGVAGATAPGQAPGAAAKPASTPGDPGARATPAIALVLPTSGAAATPVPTTAPAIAQAKPGGGPSSAPPPGQQQSPSSGQQPGSSAQQPTSGQQQPGAPGAPAPRPTVAPVSTRIPVTWRVIGDPSGRWAYDDQGRVAGHVDEGASLVLFPETIESVDYSAMVSTSTCQSTMVFRAQDDENLMMVIYIPDGLVGTAGGGVWLYQRVEGLDIPIRAVRPGSMKPAGQAVRLRVAAEGSQILVTLDGETAIQAVDTAPREGKLGLLVYSAGGRQCEATFGEILR